MLKQIFSASAACIVCMSLATTAFAATGGFTEGGMPIAGGEFSQSGAYVGADTTATTGVASTGAAANAIYVEGIEHIVVEGDTLGHLSVNYFGNFNYHEVLYTVNADVFAKSGGILMPGMALFIPNVIGDAHRYNWPVAGADEVLYTVKGGETLGGIAQVQYPNILNAAEIIFERNDDRLVNIHSIYEGQVIVLPAIEYTEVAVRNQASASASASASAPVGGNGALAPGALG